MAEFLKQNWGNVASVLGLAVSVCVLIVAEKAREAAEKARSYARVKSLVEELEEANNKIHRAGGYLRDRKWEIAQFLTDETLAACRSALARWSRELHESKNTLLRACTVLGSVGDSCRSAAVEQLVGSEWQLSMAAQLEALELISTVLGQVRKTEEGSSQA